MFCDFDLIEELLSKAPFFHKNRARKNLLSKRFRVFLKKPFIEKTVEEKHQKLKLVKKI